MAISHVGQLEESLRESSQFAERQCAEKEAILVGVTVFPCPNSIKESRKSGEACQCAM